MSDDPCIVLAKSPIIESGPYNLKILSISTNVLFPDILLKKHIGIISLVIFILERIGVKKSNVSFKILLLTKIFTAKTIATKLGSILNEVIIPSLAPIKNSS